MAPTLAQFMVVRMTRIFSWVTLFVVFMAPGSPQFVSSLFITSGEDGKSESGNYFQLLQLAPFAITQSWMSFSGASVVCIVGVHIMVYAEAADWTVKRLK